jgi:hypothetical protein
MLLWAGSGAAALLLWILIIPTSALGAGNLLNNGDFTRGSGSSVDGWRSDAWVLTAGTTEYKWIAPHGREPGQVEIFSHRDNDARWVQGLSLSPGWYHISVEARTRKVLPFFTGASISVLEDSIISRDLRGNTDWTKLDLYLLVGPLGADIDVALRLGTYMNLTRGQAWFRHARVVKIAAPPRDARYVFDLTAIRKTEATGPIGHPWTLVVAFVTLSAAAVTGWRMMSKSDLPPQSEIRTREHT